MWENDVGSICGMILVGDFGSLGCGALWDIQSIPQFIGGASVLIFVEISCVFGELFIILFKSYSWQKLAFTFLDF